MTALNARMALFTGLSLATLQTYRSEAQTALHQVLTLKRVARITTADGKTVAFGPTDIAQLRSYLHSLDTAIAILEGTTGAGLPYSVATWTR
jgi:hypothetical protein